MKRLIGLFSVFMLLMVACDCPTYAQSELSEKIVVNTSDLTVDQLAKIKAEQELASLQAKFKAYGKWVGVGKEVGSVVEESLMAVVDVADKFGKTDVGKFTLLMVAWKIMGKEAIRICFGVILLFILTGLCLKAYKIAYKPKKVLIKDPGFLKYPKEYKVIETDDDWDGYNFMKFFYPIIYFMLVALVFAMMFA